jgi:predicted ABC-type ATPase
MRLYLASQAVVYDNSGPEPRKMIEVEAGIITWQATSTPLWVAQLVRSIEQDAIGGIHS